MAERRRREGPEGLARRLKRLRSLLASEAQAANGTRRAVDEALERGRRLARLVANLHHATEGLGAATGGVHTPLPRMLCACPEPAVPPPVLRRHLVAFGALLTLLRRRPEALAAVLTRASRPLSASAATQLVLCFLFRHLWLPSEDKAVVQLICAIANETMAGGIVGGPSPIAVAVPSASAGAHESSFSFSMPMPSPPLTGSSDHPLYAVLACSYLRIAPGAACWLQAVLSPTLIRVAHGHGGGGGAALRVQRPTTGEPLPPLPMIAAEAAGAAVAESLAEALAIVNAARDRILAAPPGLRALMARLGELQATGLGGGSGGEGGQAQGSTCPYGSGGSSPAHRGSDGAGGAVRDEARQSSARAGDCRQHPAEDRVSRTASLFLSHLLAPATATPEAYGVMPQLVLTARARARLANIAQALESAAAATTPRKVSDEQTGTMTHVREEEKVDEPRDVSCDEVDRHVDKNLTSTRIAPSSALIWSAACECVHMLKAIYLQPARVVSDGLDLAITCTEPAISTSPLLGDGLQSATTTPQFESSFPRPCGHESASPFPPSAATGWETEPPLNLADVSLDVPVELPLAHLRLLLAAALEVCSRDQSLLRSDTCREMKMAVSTEPGEGSSWGARALAALQPATEVLAELGITWGDESVEIEVGNGVVDEWMRRLREQDEDNVGFEGRPQSSISGDPNYNEGGEMCADYPCPTSGRTSDSNPPLDVAGNGGPSGARGIEYDAAALRRLAGKLASLLTRLPLRAFRPLQVHKALLNPMSLAERDLDEPVATYGDSSSSCLATRLVESSARGEGQISSRNVLHSIGWTELEEFLAREAAEAAATGNDAAEAQAVECLEELRAFIGDEENSDYGEGDDAEGGLGGASAHLPRWLPKLLEALSKEEEAVARKLLQARSEWREIAYRVAVVEDGSASLAEEERNLTRSYWLAQLSSFLPTVSADARPGFNFVPSSMRTASEDASMPLLTPPTSPPPPVVSRHLSHPAAAVAVAAANAAASLAAEAFPFFGLCGNAPFAVSASSLPSIERDVDGDAPPPPRRSPAPESMAAEVPLNASLGSSADLCHNCDGGVRLGSNDELATAGGPDTTRDSDASPESASAHGLRSVQMSHGAEEAEAATMAALQAVEAVVANEAGTAAMAHLAEQPWWKGLPPKERGFLLSAIAPHLAMHPSTPIRWSDKWCLPRLANLVGTPQALMRPPASLAIVQETELTFPSVAGNAVPSPSTDSSLSVGGGEHVHEAMGPDIQLPALKEGTAAANTSVSFVQLGIASLQHQKALLACVPAARMALVLAAMAPHAEYRGQLLVELLETLDATWGSVSAGYIRSDSAQLDDAADTSGTSGVNEGSSSGRRRAPATALAWLLLACVPEGLGFDLALHSQSDSCASFAPAESDSLVRAMDRFEKSVGLLQAGPSKYASHNAENFSPDHRPVAGNMPTKSAPAERRTLASQNAPAAIPAPDVRTSISWTAGDATCPWREVSSLRMHLTYLNDEAAATVSVRCRLRSTFVKAHLLSLARTVLAESLTAAAHGRAPHAITEPLHSLALTFIKQPDEMASRLAAAEAEAASQSDSLTIGVAWTTPGEVSTSSSSACRSGNSANLEAASPRLLQLGSLVAGILRHSPCEFATALSHAGLLTPRVARGEVEAAVQLLLCSLFGSRWRNSDDALFRALAQELCGRQLRLRHHGEELAETGLMQSPRLTPKEGTGDGQGGAVAEAVGKMSFDHHASHGPPSEIRSRLDPAFNEVAGSRLASSREALGEFEGMSAATLLWREAFVPRLLSEYLRTIPGGSAWLQHALGRVIEQVLELVPPVLETGSPGFSTPCATDFATPDVRSEARPDPHANTSPTRGSANGGATPSLPSPGGDGGAPCTSLLTDPMHAYLSLHPTLRAEVESDVASGTSPSLAEHYHVVAALSAREGALCSACEALLDDVHRAIATAPLPLKLLARTVANSAASVAPAGQHTTLPKGGCSAAGSSSLAADDAYDGAARAKVGNCAPPNFDSDQQLAHTPPGILTLATRSVLNVLFGLYLLPALRSPEAYELKLPIDVPPEARENLDALAIAIEELVLMHPVSKECVSETGAHAVADKAASADSFTARQPFVGAMNAMVGDGPQDFAYKLDADGVSGHLQSFDASYPSPVNRQRKSSSTVSDSDPRLRYFTPQVQLLAPATAAACVADLLNIHTHASRDATPSAVPFSSEAPSPLRLPPSESAIGWPGQIALSPASPKSSLCTPDAEFGPDGTEGDTLVFEEGCLLRMLAFSLRHFHFGAKNSSLKTHCRAIFGKGSDLAADSADGLGNVGMEAARAAWEDTAYTAFGREGPLKALLPGTRLFVLEQSCYAPLARSSDGCVATSGNLTMSAYPGDPVRAMLNLLSRRRAAGGSWPPLSGAIHVCVRVMCETALARHDWLLAVQAEALRQELEDYGDRYLNVNSCNSSASTGHVRGMHVAHSAVRDAPGCRLARIEDGGGKRLEDASTATWRQIAAWASADVERRSLRAKRAAALAQIGEVERISQSIGGWVRSAVRLSCRLVVSRALCGEQPPVITLSTRKHGSGHTEFCFCYPPAMAVCRLCSAVKDEIAALAASAMSTVDSQGWQWGGEGATGDSAATSAAFSVASGAAGASGSASLPESPRLNSTQLTSEAALFTSFTSGAAAYTSASGDVGGGGVAGLRATAARIHVLGRVPGSVHWVTCAADADVRLAAHAAMLRSRRLSLAQVGLAPALAEQCSLHSFERAVETLQALSRVSAPQAKLSILLRAWDAVLGVLALICDGPSADDYLPIMAWVLTRAVVENLASSTSAVVNFSAREDFEEMWVIHFVASIGLMARITPAVPHDEVVHGLNSDAPPLVVPEAGVQGVLPASIQSASPPNFSIAVDEGAWPDLSTQEPPPPPPPHSAGGVTGTNRGVAATVRRGLLGRVSSEKTPPSLSILRVAGGLGSRQQPAPPPSDEQRGVSRRPSPDHSLNASPCTVRSSRASGGSPAAAASRRGAMQTSRSTASSGRASPSPQISTKTVSMHRALMEMGYTEEEAGIGARRFGASEDVSGAISFLTELQCLLGMGFDSSTACAALEEAGGELELAAQILADRGGIAVQKASAATMTSTTVDRSAFDGNTFLGQTEVATDGRTERSDGGPVSPRPPIPKPRVDGSSIAPSATQPAAGAAPAATSANGPAGNGSGAWISRRFFSFLGEGNVKPPPPPAASGSVASAASPACTASSEPHDARVGDALSYMSVMCPNCQSPLRVRGSRPTEAGDESLSIYQCPTCATRFRLALHTPPPDAAVAPSPAGDLESVGGIAPSEAVADERRVTEESMPSQLPPPLLPLCARNGTLALPSPNSSLSSAASPGHAHAPINASPAPSYLAPAQVFEKHQLQERFHQEMLPAKSSATTSLLEDNSLGTLGALDSAACAAPLCTQMSTSRVHAPLEQPSLDQTSDCGNFWRAPTLVPTTQHRFPSTWLVSGQSSWHQDEPPAQSLETSLQAHVATVPNPQSSTPIGGLGEAHKDQLLPLPGSTTNVDLGEGGLLSLGDDATTPSTSMTNESATPSVDDMLSSVDALQPQTSYSARQTVFQANCPSCQTAVRFILPPGTTPGLAQMGLRCVGCFRAFSVQVHAPALTP